MKINVVPNKSRLMISHEGLRPCASGVNPVVPSRIQVEACKQWLMKFAKKKHLSHGKRLNSYYLKHVVEEAVEQYVSNGALIQAAVELGFEYAPSDGPNAFFHIDLKLPEDEWKRVKPTGFTKWLFKQEELLLTADAKADPTLA